MESKFLLKKALKNYNSKFKSDFPIIKFTIKLQRIKFSRFKRYCSIHTVIPCFNFFLNI